MKVHFLDDYRLQADSAKVEKDQLAQETIKAN